MQRWSPEVIRYLHTAADRSRYYTDLARELGAFLHPEDRVCDAGCGLGLLSRALLPYCGHVTAIDRSPAAIADLTARGHDPRLTALTGDIRETLRRYDKLADYSFPFTFDREVFVCADRLRISQVVYNLVNNAINYAGADKTVSLRQVAANGVVRVEIRDTGEGIPVDKLPYIWDRYYKVDKDHRRAQVGTGLGLSIVKNILDMHGGRYGVTSMVGQGSTFWFELPEYTPAPPAQAEN